MESSQFPSPIQIRLAAESDAAIIVQLIRHLAESEGENSPIAIHTVEAFMQHSGNGAFLAVLDGAAVGLISFSISPNLYHAQECCLIEELIVSDSHRGLGIGSMLIEAVIDKAEKMRCAEISVSTMPDNSHAIHFYKKHGFVDEAVLLEKHFSEPDCNH